MSFIDFLNEKPKNFYQNGVYVAVLPDESTKQSILDFQQEHLQDIEVNEKIHCTIIYSAKTKKDKIPTSNIQHNAVFDKYDLFGEEKDTLVMKLKCDSLYLRNDELTKEYDFISDFEYNPHITLAYGVKDFDLTSLAKFEGSIVLKDEYTEDVDDGWEE